MVSGCGVVHLHDEVKATSSKEAVEQYAKIDLQQGIKKRQANFEKLEAAYVTAVDKRWAMQRDVALAIAINFPLKKEEGKKQTPNTLRELVLGKTFGVRAVLKRFGLKSRADIAKMISTVTKYHGALKRYGGKQDAFKKAFGTETRKLSKALACIRDPNGKKCTPAAKNGGADKTKKAEPAPGLPTPLVTLTFRPTACLSKKVPAQATPAYFQYNFKGTVPEGLSDADAKEVAAKLAKMKAAYDDFDKAIGKAYTDSSTSYAFECANSAISELNKLDTHGKGGKEYADELIKAMNDAAEYQDDLATKRTELDKKTKAYNEKAAALGFLKKKKKKDGEEEKDELKENLGKIKEIIEEFDEAGDIAGLEIASDEQLKAINAMIDALIEGKADDAAAGDDESLKKATAIAETIGSLRIRFQELGKKKAEIKLSALLTQRRISEAKKKWAEKRAAIQQQRIDLLNSRFITLAYKRDASDDNGRRSVLKLYEDAFNRLNKYLKLDPGTNPINNGAKGSGWDTEKISDFLDLLKPGTPINEDSTAHLSQALVELATAHQLENTNRDKVNLKLKMLEGRAVLAKNEMSLLMWDAIIRGPLSLVTAYHQTGIKPEELAKLVTLAGGFVSVGLGD